MSDNFKASAVLFAIVFLGSYLGTLCGGLHSANIQKNRTKHEVLTFIEEANKIMKQR